MKKAALYLRVSRKGGQETANQRPELVRFAEALGWQIVATIEERISGAKGVEDCPGLTELFLLASRREIDVVLVWALDRFSRRSIAETFEMIARLKRTGVEFWSYKEELFRTTGPAGDLLLAVAAFIAAHERQRISDRVRAGLNRAQEQGKQLGRPRMTIDMDTLNAWIAAGKSPKKFADDNGISRSLVYKKLKEKATE